MNAARKRCSVVRRQAQQLRKRRTGGNTADYSARRALLQKIAGQPSSAVAATLVRWNSPSDRIDRRHRDGAAPPPR